MSFPTLREDVEKSASVIKAASERKAAREEVCPLFKIFAGKDAKMIAFLETNPRTCGPPPGPTLSDALGGPIIADDESAKKPGRGTFDTLTGNVLAR